MSLQQASRSSRGVLLSVVCLSVFSKPQEGGGLGPLGLSSHEKKTMNYRLNSGASPVVG